ncbi:MAG: 30S ribosomal protein S9 [Planctomycetia bacterium]|nr:30S ribosomal protein S9 [Planctomycetia bacterium]
MENAANESQEQPAEATPTPAETTPGPAAEPSVAEGLDIGSQAPEAAAEPRLPHIVRGRIEADGTAVSTGRRKTAVARVRVRKGNGKITVNGREFEDYFPVERHRLLIEAPLKATGVYGQVDIWVRANGGGVNGQAGAVILGVARAIQALHPEQHGALSDGGFLTRDDRMVERKKYGHRKARRSFQFSKR